MVQRHSGARDDDGQWSNYILRGLLVGQHRDDVAFKQLLNQVERIDDLADLRDAAVAKRVKAAMSNCTMRSLLRLRKNARIIAATLSPSATRIGTS